MSDEAIWKAKLERADQRIAELETKLKNADTMAQTFAGTIANAAVHLGLLTKEEVAGLDGLRLIRLFETIVHQAEDAVAPTLHEQVLAFHKRFGQSIGEKPHVPDEKTMRFRLSLIAEEFFELLDACGMLPGEGVRVSEDQEALATAGAIVLHAIKNYSFNVDLPAFVDATLDLDYVVEGTRITLGVDGAPIAAEVHRANMAKLPSYVAAKDASHRREDDPCGCDLMTTGMQHEPDCWKVAAPVKRADGKILKPEGWKPPDIDGKLREQGWEG